MTPHIEAKKEDIAKTVIMPGDPLRAKFIADNFLKDYKLVNEVRGMLAYTGDYKGQKVTVMGSGMGNPSMGIYSYELFKFYDVDNIIRVGSCGIYTKKLKIYDVLLVEKSYSESTYANVQSESSEIFKYSSKELNEKLESSSKELGYQLNKVTAHCSDVFYKERNKFQFLYQKYGCSCVEMETFALFHNAKLLGKNASAILTVSDSLVTKEETTSKERETSFVKMMEIALNSLNK